MHNVLDIICCVIYNRSSMGTLRRSSAGQTAWYLYIVRCRDDTFYTGITNNLKRRLAQHNAGIASRYTRSRLPVVLIHHERCSSRSNALRKEHHIKQLSRLEKEAYIGNHG